MNFRDDDRGASVQVGAILLFGFLVVAVATWQATVVPQENARVEFTHSQRVTDDMQDVRNAIVSAPGSAAIRSVGVDMAPEYPPRTIFVNPGPPSGTLRTDGTADDRLNVTVTNAVAADDETADYWDGTPTRYNTGGLVYEPGYNAYTSAPTTVYETTVLYTVQDSGAVVNLTGQDVVDGRTLTLVTLNGSLARTTSATYSVDLEALSSSANTVSISDDGGDPITVSFASRRSPGWWNGTLHDADELDEDGGHVVDVRAGTPPPVDGFYNVTLELEAGVTYELRMAKVGVGAGATDPEEAYAVAVAGDGASVQVGNTRQLVVEVRDGFNNPVNGVTVELDGDASSLDDGSLDATAKTTGADGRATFEYMGDSAGTDTVVLEISDDASPLARERASFDVTVTGSGGGDTTGPATSNVATSPTGPYSAGDTFTLSGEVSDVARGGTQLIAAEWYSNATGDPGAGNANPMTASDGAFDTVEEAVEATVDTSGWAAGDYELSVRGRDANGNWGPVDSTVVTVESATGNPPTINTFEIDDSSNQGQGARFDVAWDVTDPDGDLQSVTVYVNDTDAGATAATYTGASGTRTFDPNGGFQTNYEFRVVAEDAAGNRACYVIADQADGSGVASKANGNGGSC